MSASPMARQATDSQSIPARKVFINDSNELPHSYSTTPGGTLYSTTPGGTKIVYEKSFLLNLRQSPISKTPPTYGIPENLIKGAKNSPPKRYQKHISTALRNHNNSNHNNNNKKYDDEDQFQIDL